MSEISPPLLDTSIFYSVLETGSPAQRKVLASQLAQFLAGNDATAGEREAIVPVLLKLAVDPEREIRSLLARGLADVPDLSADILYSIVADEDDIALPFLAATPALGHWHMLAILKVGDAARQACVAARNDVSIEAVTYALDNAEAEAGAALLDNPAVALGPAHYQTLYKRFPQAAEITERLLARDDLPPDIRILQTRRAAQRLQQLMTERGWVPANDADALIADAEEVAMLRVLVEATANELPKAIDFLVGRSMLTPSLIVRAACLGEMHVVEQSLAHLANVPLAKARQLMAGKGFGGFKSLHAKSGLPASCAAVLEAANEVAQDEAATGVILDEEGFGCRLVETLLTRFAALPLRERTKQLEYVSRFADDRARLLARRLREDLARAA